MAVLGLDVGGSFIKVGVLEDDELVHREAVRVDDTSYERFLNQLLKIYEPLRERFEIDAIGIGLPGAVKFPEGIMTQSPHLPILENAPLLEDLRQRWSERVIAANDVSLAAYGEYWRNPDLRRRKARVVVYLAIGTGLGGGIISHDRVLWGAQGFAGEIGHISIDPHGPKCACGSRGCLEVYVSSSGVLRLTQEVLWKYPGSSLRRFNLENLRAEDIFEAARFGDEAAHEVIEQAALALGVGLGAMINIFNPDAIVVGGGVMGSNEFFLKRAAQLAQGYAFRAPYRHCMILTSYLKYYAGVWGAALFARDWFHTRQPQPSPTR